MFRGRKIARVVTSPDGLVILVGKNAKDNDAVTFKLARDRDFWFHVAAQSGSHVVVLNPDKLERLPKATEALAAGLAAYYSGARSGGQVAVHMAQRREVSKPRGAPAGQVTLRRFKSVKARPVSGD